MFRLKRPAISSEIETNEASFLLKQARSKTHILVSSIFVIMRRANYESTRLGETAL